MSENGDRSGGSNKYEKCVARIRNDRFSKIRFYFQQKQTSVEFIKYISWHRLGYEMVSV